jgi:ketosteroid isomerase-like protein
MEAELISLCQRVLDSIAQQDWDAYTELCDPSLSAFEPEGRGHLIEGMPFHKFYFELQASGFAKQSTISSPKVRIMGDVAVVSYVRLVQALQEDGSVPTFPFEETRVWEKQNGSWKHVHFHRSVPG